jgi:AraC-like DNA-binding protein
LIVHELHNASPVPISVTLPSDSRALAVAQATIADLATARSLFELCAAAGASVRTIERAFRHDVGTSFEVWRRQARLMKAVELLTEGRRSVKEVAYDVGYRQTSAFVEMFRRTMGTTPKAWSATFIQPPRSSENRNGRRHGEFDGKNAFRYRSPADLAARSRSTPRARPSADEV